MAMLLLLVLFVVVSLDCDSWRACSSEERSCVFFCFWLIIINCLLCRDGYVKCSLVVHICMKQ